MGTMKEVKMSSEQFAVLARAALAGSDDVPTMREYIEKIEKENGIRRYRLLIRWRTPAVQRLSDAQFPLNWPPSMTATLDQETVPRKSDVEAIVASSGTRYTDIVVTRDLTGQVGWQTIEEFFR